MAESGHSRVDLVEVLQARNRVEGEMIQRLLEDGGIQSLLQPTGINGPLIGVGLLPHDAQRVMVRSGEVEAARTLLAETLAENEQGDLPEPVNASHLDATRGRGPRSYGLIGAYARIYLWSFLIIAVAFGVFLLLHAV